jgi:hypothetical protein
MKKQVFLLGVFLVINGFLSAAPTNDQIEQAANMLEIPVEEVKALVEKYHKPSLSGSSNARNATFSTIGEIGSNIGKKTLTPGFYTAEARFVSFDGSTITLQDMVTEESLMCRTTARITLEYTRGVPVSVVLRVEDAGWSLQATVVEITKK